jgi:hypothetical protein
MVGGGGGVFLLGLVLDTWGMWASNWHFWQLGQCGQEAKV